LTFAEELRPGASAVEVLAWTRALPEEKVLVVGHNPTLQELVGLLIAGEESGMTPRLGELRKGEVVLFSANPEGQLLLDWAAPPRLLRRLGD
jgi:phosphohistidine phosphatase SixA